MFYIVSSKAVEGKFSVLSSHAKRADARARAKVFGGSVRNQVEYDKLVAADKVVVAPVVVNPMLAIAKELKAAVNTRKTLNLKPVKAPARVPTPPEVLKEAEDFFLSGVKAESTKCVLVRGLSGWRGNLLQRRDVIKIVAAHPETGIAYPTVTTQFFYVRSGRFPEYSAA